VSRAVVLRAPAKINLTLEVLGRRPDGYHELASVFATIDLSDRVRVATSRVLDVRVSPDVAAESEDELTFRAVRALATACARVPGAHVRVRKRIPVAAGLGGGSSDAGAALRALARVWRLDGIELGAVGATVGSDVPFFASGAAFGLVRGRGERVEPLPPPAGALWIALVRLREGVSTAEVFAAHRAAPSDGARTGRLADALRRGRATVSLVRAHLGNDLLAAAEEVAPAIARARQAAEAAGVALILSGSGPSLFAIADDRAHALRIARRLRRIGLRARAHAVGAAPTTSERGLSP